jgi:membrane protease YdiL (CAAX protease family)
MDLLSPLEWLFGLLTLTGLVLILVGHKTLSQGLRWLHSRFAPHIQNADSNPFVFLPSYPMLGLLLTLLTAWLFCGLVIPPLLQYTAWPPHRIEAINLIIQSLGFQAIGVTVIAGTLRTSGIAWRSLLDPRPVGANFGRALVAYLVIIPPIFLISAANEALLSGWGYPLSFQEVVEIFRRMDHPGLKSLLVFAIIGMAPLFEEILFRGLLFPWLAGRFGWAGGILISSAFFALIHFHLPSALPLAALGIALCLLYALSGRLILCVFVHMLFNSINLFAVTLWGG